MPCKKCNPVNPKLFNSDPQKLSSKAFEDFVKKIHEGSLKPGDIDPDLIKQIAKELKQALFNGFGKDFDNELSEAEFNMLVKLEKNLYVFSGFKTEMELREVNTLLKDEQGNLRSYEDFRTQVKFIDETYNEVYLNAEYNNAVASSAMAAQWEQFESQKEAVPLLQYSTAGDDRVREEHAMLEGITLPVDDPFWSTYYPPNDWGCRCDVIPIVEGETTDLKERLLPDLKPMFENNVGKDGQIFPDTHPYFDVQKKQRKEMEKEFSKLAPKRVYDKNQE